MNVLRLWRRRDTPTARDLGVPVEIIELADLVLRGTKQRYPWAADAKADLAYPSNLVAWKTVTGAAPSAGNEFTTPVAASKWWLAFSVRCVLVQGITQTPQPILQIDDGTNVFMESPGSSAVQAVSTTCAYTWGPGYVQTGQIGSGAAVRSVAPMPEGMILPGGYHIKSSTLGIGANSAYGAPIHFVAELG